MPIPKNAMLPSELYPVWPPMMSQVEAIRTISHITAIWLV
jgi:hypothetical protein